MGRFDQTERKPARERRSRSPSSRNSETVRSRSPLAQETSDPPKEQGKLDAVARAKAAAERINAQRQAKQGIQTVDVPPIRTPSSEPAKKSSGQAGVSDEIYTQDGDYIRDIEVNDLRNRYMLTKGSTQKQIKEDTGADVTTRGEYYPDKSMATAAAPPLYLHVTSTSKEGLEKAVEQINELMQQELPNLVDERRFRRREPEVERDELGRRKWPEERIPIDLEPIPGFNLRAQVVGHGGAYVKHIQQETRCRVQIKGQGSGFMEPLTGRESDEPMYLHVAGPDPSEVKRARGLCEDLLGSVKGEYEKFKERGGSRARFGGDGNSNGRGYGNRDSQSHGHGHGQNQDQYGGYGAQQSPGGHGSPQAYGSGTPGAAANSQDYSAQYAQYAQYYAQNPQADPYAAYGGYANYMAMYQQYYGQAAQSGTPTQASPPPGGQAAAPPPPPPPAEQDAPPPPPPSYSNVPPPPGL